MQQMLARVDGSDVVLSLPAEDREVLPGIVWGRFDELLTPAYWRGQAWQHELLGTYEPGPLGRNLVEEVAACMLGGYGIPAELGLAAFDRVRREQLLHANVKAAELEAALARPFTVGNRSRHYRFPAAKGRALAGATRALPSIDESLPDKELRDALCQLPGIGLKTASWIVRNVRLSDAVAIIDVHITRAGQIAGFMRDRWLPATHYFAMEDAFIKFSTAIEVRPSVLDGLMWDYMRCMGPLARESGRLSRIPCAQSPELMATPTAAVPQATIRLSCGNKAVAKPDPRLPKTQKPRPRLVAQRCNTASNAPASRQSRLPGFA